MERTYDKSDKKKEMNQRRERNRSLLHNAGDYDVEDGMI